MLSENSLIGVIGSGAMGSGIAQVAASAGHSVVVFDNNIQALQKAETSLTASLQKLVEKQKITAEQQKNILQRTRFVSELNQLGGSHLIIEAIVENLDVKKNLFSELEKIVDDNCVLATNTSSLSVTSIAAACRKPGRVIGIHFFNPATIMQLVEIIPGIAT
ncbi:MAG TPA: 3-hydroxyacyl-CoA dehydrogenase NAD-binding domain-containing protein, partial [Bacteroidia bacterium]|nr:3-hydroxyacyl-CoA dehydrogenase NAD-binding domain-containing protein [Bacteroidia bacterium]